MSVLMHISVLKMVSLCFINLIMIAILDVEIYVDRN